ncbi:uncharacterized membrane protein YhaH (DUF805 family) [Bradyrhizobium sp. GM22.5]
MDWIWYLFRFDGRINRALLWQALLLVMMLACMLGMIDQAIKVLNGAATFAFNFKVDFDFGVDDIFNVVDPRAYRQLATADRATLILKVFGTLLFLWIYLATATKRLHDRDRSGWWLVPFFVVPALFDQFSDLLPTNSNWGSCRRLGRAHSVVLGPRGNVHCARHLGRQPVRPRSTGRP